MIRRSLLRYYDKHAEQVIGDKRDPEAHSRTFTSIQSLDLNCDPHLPALDYSTTY